MIISCWVVLILCLYLAYHGQDILVNLSLHFIDMRDRIPVDTAFFFTHVSYVWCSIFLFCRWYLRLNQNIPQSYWNTGENCENLWSGEEKLPCTLRNTDSLWCSYLCFSYLNTGVSWQWFWGQLLPIMFQSPCHFPIQAPFLDIHVFQREIFQMQAESTDLAGLSIGS